MEEEDEEEKEEEEEEEEEAEEEILESNSKEIPRFRRGDRIRATHKITGQTEEWNVLKLAGKRSSKKWSDSYNVQEAASGMTGWVNLKEYTNIQQISEEEEILLSFEDNRILEAKEKELKSWTENGVFEEVEDVGQKTISTRWIVTEKVKGEERVCKARLVVRGFEEDMADWEKDAPTCNAEILKLCLSIIQLKNWTCRTLDIKTAYLQGENIKREIYIKPPKEVICDGLWQLKKTVYGLKDAAKAWYEKVVKVVSELGGNKSRLEPNVFYWKKGGEVIGLLCSHVDDFCYGGEETFMDNLITRLKDKLRIGEQESNSFKYIGVWVRQEEDRICVEQCKYVDQIREPEVRRFGGTRILEAKELTEYRSVVGQLNWVALHTMPELSFDISSLSKAFKEGTTQDMKKLTRVVRKAKRIRGKIVLETLKKERLFWEVYADASFGNVEEGSTQIGYIISLTDGYKRCPIWWKSRKARRVAKSTIEAEALSVGEALEGAIYFNKLWEELVNGEKLEVVIKTDSKTLVKAIKSNTGVSSKRLKIDVAAIKECLEQEEVKEIEWISGKYQTADELTKGVSEENIRKYVEGRYTEAELEI